MLRSGVARVQWVVYPELKVLKMGIEGGNESNQRSTLEKYPAK
jgi:hypothetical protein